MKITNELEFNCFEHASVFSVNKTISLINKLFVNY